MTDHSPAIPHELTVDEPARRPGLRSGLSWSFVGGIGAGALLFAQLIFAGRLLGPDQFGTFSFIQAFAMVLLIPSLAGFDMASSRALARANSRTEQQRIAASSIAAVTACSVVAAAIVLMLADPLADMFGSSAPVISYGAIFTVFLAQRWLMERELSGLGRFPQQAAVRFAEALLTIATFATLQLTHTLTDYRSLVVAYCVGAVAVVGGAHATNGLRLRIRDVTWASIRRLLLFSWLMNGAYLAATILLQADRFAVNATLGAHQLGIYAAYASSTVFVVIQLLLVISNVLYPTMATVPDKHRFVRRLDRIAPLVFVASLAVLLGVLVVVLALFGASFPFDAVLATIFATWASLALVNGTYAVIVNAHTERSCARELAFQPVRIAFLATWFVAWGVMGRLTLELTAAGMLLSECMEAVNLRLVIRGYVLDAPTPMLDVTLEP